MTVSLPTRLILRFVALFYIVALLIVTLLMVILLCGHADGARR